MAGIATPSASPKKARTARRLAVEWVAAQGVRSVDKDHKATPQASTFFPPYLSTRAPPITDENMYPHRNDDCQHKFNISTVLELAQTQPEKLQIISKLTIFELI